MLHISPGWNGLHVLIVHVPIIVLLVAPLLVMEGTVLSAAQKRQFLGSALTLMVVGTAMIFVAVATGEMAMKVVGSTPAITAALEEHRILAETTRELFLLLTLGFAALLFVPRLLGRELESWVSKSLFAAFLLFYGTGAVLLVDTALKGGRLVHELDARPAVTSNLPREVGVR